MSVMSEEVRLKRARYFAKCLDNHRGLWNLISNQLSDEENLKVLRKKYHNLDELKKYCLSIYCSENNLLWYPPYHCFACAISNVPHKVSCTSTKAMDCVPCMVFWGESRCTHPGTHYMELGYEYQVTFFGSKELSDLAKSISKLPLNPEAFYTYVDLYPGDKMKHFKGRTYTFDGISQHTETGELFVNYHREGTNYIRPLMMFFEKVDKPEYYYHGPRFRKEDNNE